MVIKRQKIWKNYLKGKFLQTSWWLFGIIPIYISNKLIGE